jgi:hypothetical protein
MELADEKGAALVVDYSGASGAPALLAQLGAVKVVNAKKAKLTELKVGDATVTVLTLAAADQPTPEVAGKTIKVGAQTITVDAGKLTLATFTDAK